MRLAKNVKGIDGRMDRQGGNEVAESEVKDKGEKKGSIQISSHVFRRARTLYATRNCIKDHPTSVMQD